MITGIHNQTTVVIAAYNAHETICETLKSLLDSKMRHGNYHPQIIIVDDGSSPAIWTALSNDPLTTQCRLIRLSANHGLWFARNTGVSYAGTPYITFVDADDLVSPDFFNILETDLHDEPCAVATRYSAWYPETDRYAEDVRQFPSSDRQRMWITKGCFMPSFSTVRREVFLELGGYRPDVTEDWDFWLRFFRHGHTAIRSAKNSYIYRVRPNSLSRRGDLPARDLVTIKTAQAETSCPIERIALLVSRLNWAWLARQSQSAPHRSCKLICQLITVGIQLMTASLHYCLFAYSRVALVVRRSCKSRVYRSSAPS